MDLITVGVVGLFFTILLGTAGGARRYGRLKAELKAQKEFRKLEGEISALSAKNIVLEGRLLLAQEAAAFNEHRWNIAQVEGAKAQGKSQILEARVVTIEHQNKPPEPSDLAEFRGLVTDALVANTSTYAILSSGFQRVIYSPT